MSHSGGWLPGMRTRRVRNVCVKAVPVLPSVTPSTTMSPGTAVPEVMSVADTVTDTDLLSGTGYGLTATVSRLTSGPSGMPASAPSGTARTSAQVLPRAVSTAGDVTHRLARF